MRLIDADALKEAFYERGLGFKAIDEIIDEAPVVMEELVSIVRCEKCERRGTELCAMHYECRCGRTATWAGDGEFCSYGERKE